MTRIDEGSVVTAKRRSPATILALIGCLIVVAGPKVTLLAVSGGSVRFEDIALALTAVWFVTTGYKTYSFDKVDKALWIFIAAQLVALLAGIAMKNVSPVVGLLYALRPAEYWFIRPLVRKIPEYRDTNIVLVAATVLLVGSSVLQAAGLDIGTSAFGGDRTAGLTTGPFEAAAVAAGLALFWLSGRHWTWFFACCLTLALTQSRTSTAALAIVLVVALPRLISPRGTRDARTVSTLVTMFRALATILILLYLGLGATGASTVGGTIGRLQSTSVIDAWTDAASLRSADPVITDQQSYYDSTYSADRRYVAGTLVDPSSTIRFLRWQTLLRAYVDNPQHWLTGYGPSFAFAAVDGYYVRVLIESGIVGLAVFIWFTRRTWIAFTDPATRCYIAVLLITGATIDIWVSLKPMVLLWAIAEIRQRKPAEGLRKP